MSPHSKKITDILPPRMLAVLDTARSSEASIVQQHRELTLTTLFTKQLSGAELQPFSVLARNVGSHWFAAKRCTPRPAVRIVFPESQPPLEIVLDFSCNAWSFDIGKGPSSSFFDPVRGQLLQIVKAWFPKYASAGVSSLWQKGAIEELAQHRQGFIDFLRRVAEGRVHPSDWNEHAVTHYSVPELERARQELVRAAILGGQCSAQPVQGDLCQVAERLLLELQVP